MNLLKRNGDQHVLIHLDLHTQCSDKYVLRSFVTSLVFGFS